MALSKRTLTIVLHDVVTFVVTLAAQLAVVKGHTDRDALISAVAAAAVTALHTTLPVPVKEAVDVVDKVASVAPVVAPVVDAVAPAAKPVVDEAEKVIAEAATAADAANKVAP